jgi:hypothetical protein
MMTPVKRAFFLLCFAVSLTLVCGTGGCGSDIGDAGPDSGLVSSSDAAGGFGGNDGSSTFGGSADGGAVAPCADGSGLGCYVDASCTTTLSGTVYDPAGRNPLYNVAVFIPNDPVGTLPAITPGTKSCNTCDVSIGNYIAVTTTDAKGHFTLTGVPAITHLPLVVQTGKWRREVFLPSVTACKDNAVPAADSRLPKNHKEGDLPQMALLTGGCDDLGCFMKSMGIDDAEYTAPHGGGRLDVYQGVGLGGFGGLGGGAASLSSGRAGNCTNASCPLWASKQSFEYYDIAILSCECDEHRETKPPAAMQALHDWLDEGGKVFASHYHYSWFRYGPTDFQNVATWLGATTANGGGSFDIDKSFPKGQTYAQWLENVGALQANGTINLASVASSVSTVNAPTVRWIYDPKDNDTKYLSFLTPIGGIPGSAPDAGASPAPAMEAGAPADAGAGSTAGDASNDAETQADVETPVDSGFGGYDGGLENTSPTYCGKAVFTDLHTSSSLTSQVSSIPSGCSGAAMTAQQKALEYLFFDLSACVGTSDTTPPPPPPPPR